MSSYDQDRELGEPHPHPPHLGLFFGVNLDYVDFACGIFDLCNVRIAEQSEHNRLFSQRYLKAIGTEQIHRR